MTSRTRSYLTNQRSQTLEIFGEPKKGSKCSYRKNQISSLKNGGCRAQNLPGGGIHPSPNVRARVKVNSLPLKMYQSKGWMHEQCFSNRYWPHVAYDYGYLTSIFTDICIMRFGRKLCCSISWSFSVRVGRVTLRWGTAASVFYLRRYWFNFDMLTGFQSIMTKLCHVDKIVQLIQIAGDLEHKWLMSPFKRHCF